MPHHYSPEHKQFIKDNVKGRSRIDLTEVFNAHFNLDLSVNQITAYIKNNHLVNGLDGRFKPGQEPVNKGTHLGGWEPTQFRSGNRPWNYKPVGTERITTEGYGDVKIADPKTWKQKHILIWEAINGPVPKDHCLIFADGNKLNVALDNLILISRKQLVRMNQNHLIKDDAELTKTGVLIADIYCKIGEQKKRNKLR